MITGTTGGCISRSMPPTDWDCGPIPAACFDPALSKRGIAALLSPVYLEPARVRSLADSDDPMELFKATLALEILVDVDADTIYWRNRSRYIDMHPPSGT